MTSCARSISYEAGTDARNESMSKSNLIRLSRAVFIAECLVIQQRAIVARLVSRGLDTKSDEELLLQLLHRLEILSGRRCRFLDYRDRPVPLSYRARRAESTPAEDESAYAPSPIRRTPR